MNDDTSPNETPVPDERAFRTAVDHLLLRTYGVTLSDLGMPGHYTDAFREDTTPEEFVEWFADKYELVARTEWGL